jgi:hypothetical protein
MTHVDMNPPALSESSLKLTVSVTFVFCFSSFCNLYSKPWNFFKLLPNLFFNLPLIVELSKDIVSKFPMHPLEYVPIS